MPSSAPRPRRPQGRIRDSRHVRELKELKQRLVLLDRTVARLRRRIARRMRALGREIAEARAAQTAERKATERRASISEKLIEGYIPFRSFMRRIRSQSGLTVSEAARRTGAQRTYLASVESGEIRPPKPPTIQRFAHIYDVPEQRLQLLAFTDKSPWRIRRDLISLLFPEDSRPNSFDSAAAGTSESGQETAVRRGRGHMLPFGKVLRRLRKEQGLSQLEVASRARVDSTFIAVIETRRGRVGSPTLVRRLAAVLGVDKQALQIMAYSERAPDVIRGLVLRRLAPLTPFLFPMAGRPLAGIQGPADSPSEAVGS